jgi:transposase
VTHRTDHGLDKRDPHIRGVPARLVCDNLKTGVVRPDLYDPQINLAYGELAAFYGALVDPARVRSPKDKPRVAYCTPLR